MRGERTITFRREAPLTILFSSRMLNKAVQQGRSERRGEEVPAALRVGRSPLQWVLANGKPPKAFPTSEKFLLNVEPLSDVRTPLVGVFSILLALDL